MFSPKRTGLNCMPSLTHTHARLSCGVPLFVGPTCIFVCLTSWTFFFPFHHFILFLRELLFPKLPFCSTYFDFFLRTLFIFALYPSYWLNVTLIPFVPSFLSLLSIKTLSTTSRRISRPGFCFLRVGGSFNSQLPGQKATAHVLVTRVPC